jgi:membrane fusion protein (multidrug efflux system)
MKVPSLLVSIALAMSPAVATAQTAAVASRENAPLVPAGQSVGVQVAARSTAVISAPMAGQLVEFPMADGEAIQEGQLLARFNCAQQEAVLARAQAELVKRQDLLKTQQALKSLNVYSKAEYTTAQNDVGVAKADVTVAETAVENCVVKAPFPGRVAATSVRNHQFVQAGAPLLDVVDERDLELEFIVPSPWLAWLKPGAAARVLISETGQAYVANITRISGKVDAASQTIKIYGRINGDTGALLPGMSGTAQFARAPS